MFIIQNRTMCSTISFSCSYIQNRTITMCVINFFCCFFFQFIQF
ncbi:hypothetical protein MtrunA17_Chr3g0081431 [Medicago truncatula]|uniref:Transmembrane protein n=1 Tax=Medicago truncatula TaxID=3880 RepID=A0A396IL79_MEDTR|nr:hypothetical protein MtrunA17_Chr3g0081431 [Medicago truncatula]